jgi:GT2 family glycosyltransferase
MTGGVDPSVAALIVTWNGHATCGETIASVVALAPAPGRVLVVDNGSRDDLAATLTGARPGVEVLRLPENRGVAEGRNVGLRHLLADDRVRWVLQLDDDAVVPPECLAGLRAALVADPRAGIAGPLVVHYDAPDRVWSGGGRLVFRDVAAERGAGRRPRGTAPAAADYVSGCCMLIDRAVLERVGLYDPRYFMVYQDADLCRRAARAGWRTLLVPAVRVRHHGSTSTGGGYTPGRAYFTARGTVLFARDHGRWDQRVRTALCAAAALPVALAREGLRGNARSVVMKARGYLDAVAGRSPEPVIARYFRDTAPSRCPVATGPVRGWVAAGEEPARWIELVTRLEHGAAADLTLVSRYRDREVHRWNDAGEPRAYVKRYARRSAVRELTLGRLIAPIPVRCWDAADLLAGLGIPTPAVRAALRLARGGRRIADYLVTDPVTDGRPLGEILNAAPPGTPARAHVLGEIVRLLARLHARGVFHLDLEPDNLFWRLDGGLAVLDLDALIVVAPRHATRYHLARRLDLLTVLVKLEPFTTAEERRLVRRDYAAATGLSAPARVPRALRSEWARRQVHLLRRACTATGLVR